MTSTQKGPSTSHLLGCSCACDVVSLHHSFPPLPTSICLPLPLCLSALPPSLSLRVCTHPHTPQQAAGLAALDKLDTSLVEFQGLIDAKDKQSVPIKQRECLDYVGQVEAAMVKGFPFEVPKDYANRPLLKVRGIACR